MKVMKQQLVFYNPFQQTLINKEEKLNENVKN